MLIRIISEGGTGLVGGTPRKDEKAFVEEHLLLKRIAR